MRANLELTGGLLLTEAVSTALAESVGRTRAKALVADAARRASDGGRELRDELPPTTRSSCPPRRSTARSIRSSTSAQPRRSWTVRSRRTRGGAMGDDAHERGMRVRREVLGDEHVDAAVDRTSGSPRTSRT